ncbi:MAG: hypothetical protein JXB18_13090 [Sedimentisphaerales bacterium]|nr:hypothetical protein [Sedimentisphaerales bacterium]
MRKQVFLFMCLLMLAGVVPAALIQHLDATKAGSVVNTTPILDPVDPNIIIGYKVIDWLDVSGAGNNAVADKGTVTYPSPLIFSGGFAGVDFSKVGTVAARMVLFTSAQSDSFLDFTPGTGLAAGNTGVTILAAMRDDGSVAFSPADVLANKDGGGAGFSLRHNDSVTDTSSMIWRFADSTGTGDITQNTVLPPNGSAVQAVRFKNELVADNLTGAWASSNGTKGTRTGTRTTLADYSNANPVWIGYAANANRCLDGALGEVMIYNEFLSDADYQYQIDRLERKWVTSRAVAPLDGGQVIASPTVALNWLNLLPVVQNGDVTVDVWFGTDPNRLNMTLVENDALNLAATTVNASTAGETYYWAVDTFMGSGSVDYTDPNTIKGPFYSFIPVADPAPTAINAGPDYVTWPGAGVPVNATVTDLGAANVTVTFTASDPNVVFSPNPVVIAAGGGVASTTATIDYDATADVVVTATAEDAANPGLTVADTMSMAVYGNSCQAERVGNANQPRTDIAVDCTHDLIDFAALAAAWLDDYAATAAFVNPVQPAAPAQE